jgi:hypothetical protein
MSLPLLLLLGHLWLGHHQASPKEVLKLGELDPSLVTQVPCYLRKPS